MDMRKEYRRELKQLERAEKKLWRDLEKFAVVVMRQSAKLRRAVEGAEARTEKEVKRLERRRAILRGRLN